MKISLTASPPPSLSARVIDLACRQACAASLADLERAKLHLLDWLGCAIGGAASPPGRVFLAATSLGAPPLGQLRRDITRLGGLGSLLEMDDVDRAGLVHPGPVVCSALMAAATPATSGLVLLEALIAGYEGMIRLARALGPSHYAQFHNSSTTGAFGASIAAGHVLGLTPDQQVWAAGHALSMAGGLWECRNSATATKHLHISEAARRGLQSALWAQAGLVGPAQIFEGPQGFFAGLAPKGNPDVMLHPARELLIHQVSFKIWPACRHAHAAIDAALTAAAGIALNDIREIKVTSFKDALVFCDRPQPKTSGEAKFSLQHAVALCLRYGAPALKHFEEPFLSDPELAALRERITIAEDADFTRAYPGHFGAEVSLVLHTSQPITARVSDAWGDRENPASAEDIAQKFYAITTHAGLSPSCSQRLALAIEALGPDRSAPLLALLDALPLGPFPPATVDTAAASH